MLGVCSSSESKLKAASSSKSGLKSADPSELKMHAVRGAAVMSPVRP